MAESNRYVAQKILIVDDDKLIRRALADYLGEFGHQATVVADGLAGLEQAHSCQFDVALINVRMPRMDGLEVIATLNAERPEMPIVAISGTGVLEDAIEAMRKGAWDFVTKPIHDINQVQVVIERVLERAQLLTERNRYRAELEQLNCLLGAEVDRQMVDLVVQNRCLAALNRVSYAISEPLNLDTMLRRSLDAAVASVQAEGGVVRLHNPATECLVPAATRGLPDGHVVAAQVVPMGKGLVGQVAQDGRPRTCQGLEDGPWAEPLKQAGFCSCLCVPLRAGNEAGGGQAVMGTLEVYTRDKRAFDAHEVDLLATIGNQIGVGVARVQYAADLETTNVQLERANAELRRLDTLREQFIQNVAHELRTPLALVHGYAEMLSHENLEPEQRKTALEVLARRVQVLVELVEAITILQDLGGQPLRVEPVVLAELIYTARQMTLQRARNAGVEIRGTCPDDLPPLPGDFTRLAQALHQLLDNACKFSPEGGVVSVSVRAAPEEEMVCISISDHGIGIPPDEHVRIFQRFYQVDGSLARRFGGTGLGLALVKEIVEAHGGRVCVESELGVGSTFTVCLPAGGIE